MKVALDYREAAMPNRAGKGEYIHQLSRAIIANHPDIKLVLLISPGQDAELPKGIHSAVKIPAKGALWHLLVLLWLSLVKPVDLYFATASVIIPAFVLRVPAVTTIFDFTSWRFPSTHYAHAHWIERVFMKRALMRSRALLAISKFTKQEAIELFGINPDKIHVTYLGVDHNVFYPRTITSAQKQNLQKKYNLPDQFLLCLATIEPRKNMVAAINSFQRISHKFPNLKLVLAGGKGWRSQSITAHKSKNIIFTGYIEESDKPLLYSLAQVFVFPSLYEGFGLPPLESMACGVPTVVSNRASLPEVVGSIAPQVSLEQTKALDKAIEEFLLLSNKGVDSWSKRAVNWTKQFTWSSTAEQTTKVLKSVQ